MKNTDPRSNKLLGTGLAGILILAAFFAGIQFGQGSWSGLKGEAGLLSFLGPSAQPDSKADLTEFWRVWNILEEKYVSSSSTSTPDRNKRLEGAISGLVDSYGDPYTIYMPPQEAAEFEEEISGNFNGVGMEVGMRDDVVTVIAPLPDSPAEKAGIKAGDIITKIDEQSTDNMSVDQAVRLIRGDRGTEVALTIYRRGDNDFREFKIARDVINIPTLATETADDVFIIKLYSFNALAEDKMDEAMAEFGQSGKKKLILDLRGNPGGFLESAVSIAGWFLPTGKVVVRENFGTDIEEEVYRSQGKGSYQFNPDNFVVLIDGGSASASEILAGALAEHGVAATIGDTTFGKGSVQELVNIPGGASVKVTIARWLTPNGTSFSEGGLKPEVPIILTPAEVEENKDPQQDAALEWLKGKRDFGEEKVSLGL
ncbi:hypothetical protein A2837_02070 [Candidatus Kaiserbacteria bacterium RIFCSPHIGHO2_01_FULL_46_22]|uniref:PDZ domain-containing protein n=1 Tax=Candidatus Kaiserbacteria bacterium RIFCSPHIGHO2_01_FULL_46_22 TaxID=1798475 RepID=A0A1F6BYE9_9BACT|nr:MAG: hypothetical protein A2837_02070 [Candidatus Kaiserbacteria bacterium RIFCSPHIGHO2_01_FULL_46_22]